jgi:hypothetical protein
MFHVVILPAQIGGPLRIIANRPVTGPRPATHPSLCVTTSGRLRPAGLSRGDAERVARQMRRDLERPIMVSAEEWRALRLPV